ncbi:hypothetical protein NMG29_14440 [Streptomyces cocklensis]|jgi:hypothetical protein|uniref:hypothetical protein n=1 Tax=Actinacidiphila cocklensis TaxID=887465 RepID=UPI00203D2ECA|nr:hypothetical protein [Actinacidiphila cocklensis]MDD1059393.1 hypothetical protein [Actinacidiphila cocklensis]
MTIAAITLLGAALAGCGDRGNGNAKAQSSTLTTAVSAWNAIHAEVPTSSFNRTVTAANDSNHLLGRPHQYTSAIKFKDRRVKGDDIVATDQYDVSWGGGIEVFDSNDDAKARAKYIQAVTKSMPMFAEYDYVHGPVVIRVSHYLTPTQAAEYDKAAATLG